ncbi:MAG TPA: polysaccharide deacetylase family protein [Gemmatimonadales bacterium]|nr:polysaccharide deacetylase family protein [Gemmatimonadales bacterium]
MSGIGIRIREIAAYRLGRPERALETHRGQILVLAYHNIRPRGAPPMGERSLHLAQQDFARQLDFLVRTHQVRPLADLSTSPADHRPTAVITFDDGYRGALSAGVEELGRRGLPATFFVAPGRLGDHTFWWDHLAEQSGGVMAADTRRHCLEALRGEDERVREWAARRPLDGARAVPAWGRTVTPEELERVAGLPGMTIASHSWSHPNLAALGAAEVATELERSAEWLNARIPAALPWVSFPYGRVPANARDAGPHAGYAGGVLIGEAVSWMAPPAPDTWTLMPRLNVAAGVSVERFALTTSGAW